ncbi:MAG: hypothetical protein IJH11_05020 [Lachnospiraceae bacterium]|nr:hypothetical protein [Lachnospiraceae bacterium]
MFEIILKDFAWASLLLLIGLYLRTKVKVFQKLFIPVAVIGGLVGLLLSSEVLGKFCPFYIQWSDNVSGFANPLLAILFVTQFIALSFNTKMIKKCSFIFFISATVIGAQVLSAMGLGRLFGLPDGAALLPFGAFYGAHGIPQVIAGIYDTLGYWNYDEASAFGTTYATIGMLYGIIAGIAIINIGIRRGWVSAKKAGNLSKEDYTGILNKENRFKFMTAFTSDIAFDPLTLHFSIVLAIMIIAYGLLNLLHRISIFSGFAIYVPAIIVSLVFGIIAKRTPLHDFIDSESLGHIGSLALEYLIVSAIATMKLDVIMNNAAAILTISGIGLLLTTVILMTLPKLWLKTSWLENAMVMFGAWTGSTATGMMLLRIADPELETDAGQNLITATPLWQISTQNFFLTIAPYFIVTAAGFNNLALGAAGMVAVALILGFIIGRK